MSEEFTIENAVSKPAAENIRNALGNRPVVLASGSPRRREVLELLGIDFQVYKPQVEEPPSYGLVPWRYAESLAVEKVNDASGKFPGNLIIGADTVVIIGNRILGKPRDTLDAAGMLRLLRGKEHQVITAIGICLNGDRKVSYSHEITRVFFKNFSEDDLYGYIDSGEPLDKAGSYGIQGMGRILVDRIDGELDNVIGFPLNTFAKLLTSSVNVNRSI